MGTLMPRLTSQTFADQAVKYRMIMPSCMRRQQAAELGMTGRQLGELAEAGELAASEPVTNAVRASTSPSGRALYVNGHMGTVRVCLLSEGYCSLIEVDDQATGNPVLKNVGADAESGRGLTMIDALTGGRW